MNILTSDNTIKYFVSCHPLKGVFHVGSVQDTTTRSGQPLIVHGLDQQVVLDLIFSEYTPDTLDEKESYTPHNVAWSVYTSEAEALEVIDRINEYNFLTVSHIKHPTLDQWAVPVSEPVFSSFPEGATKDWLQAKAVESVLAGRRHDRAYLLSEGWV